MNINYFYNEDCKVTIERMKQERVHPNVVLTSPPYNMTKRKGGVSDTGRYDVYQDFKPTEEYIEDTVKLFDKLNEVVETNGTILYNFSYSVENPSLPYQLVNAIVADTEWEVVDTIIWQKSNGIPFPANPRRLSRIWEFVFVFGRKCEKDTYFVNKKITKVSEKTKQRYYQIYYNWIKSKNNDNSTPKLNQATYSTDLCKQLLTLYSDKNFLVYDPFMGTGTTANACKELGMNYIGSEISKAQVEYSIKRLKNNGDTK